MNMSIVVGCSRIHAGTHPFSMNIAPSFRIERLMTSSVDYKEGDELKTPEKRKAVRSLDDKIRTFESAPDALIIRLCTADMLSAYAAHGGKWIIPSIHLLASTQSSQQSPKKPQKRGSEPAIRPCRSELRTAAKLAVVWQ